MCNCVKLKKIQGLSLLPCLYSMPFVWKWYVALNVTLKSLLEGDLKKKKYGLFQTNCKMFWVAYFNTWLKLQLTLTPMAQTSHINYSNEKTFSHLMILFCLTVLVVYLVPSVLGVTWRTSWWRKGLNSQFVIRAFTTGLSASSGHTPLYLVKHQN